MTNNELRRRKLQEATHQRLVADFTQEAPYLDVSETKTVVHPQTRNEKKLSLQQYSVLYIDNIPWHLGHRAVDHIAKSFGYHKPVYAVVMDAGSTGSRVLAYTFHESYFGGHLVLDKELFEYTKPGLSSFQDDPKKGVETLEKLLEKAKREIPKEFWSQTPLILKATAGLRLLPPEKAENLLNSVREMFNKTPFVTNEKSVEIMDGIDEGIFSWFTVNFLLERFHDSPSKTVAALDLGGGSTQATFSAQTPASLSQKENIHEAASPSGVIQVYTNSYLGLGLMAARKEVVTFNQPKDQRNVTSECVNHIIKGRKLHFGGTDYYVSGPQEKYPTDPTSTEPYKLAQEWPVVDFDRCSKIITDYVSSKAKPLDELPAKQIFAFSYYFDRAYEVGLIDEKTGGRVRIKDFIHAAKTACHDPNAEQPFMCLDLTFISVLLEKGFGLNPETTIYLYKKINGHEISWALGAAYNMLRGS